MTLESATTTTTCASSRALLSFDDATVATATASAWSAYDARLGRSRAPVASACSRACEPGEYTLHIRGDDRRQRRVRRNACCRFRVQPPWWRTAWARIAFVLLALVLLWKAASDYRTRLKRRNAWQLSEHKRELAEQASLAKTRFLATLGHEVRTPMTGVLGMSELLLGTGAGREAARLHRIDPPRRRPPDAPGQRRARPRAHRGRQAGTATRSRSTCSALVRDVVALMAPIARQRGLGFDDGIAAGRAARGCAATPVRIRQILLNLLGNAIKFTDSGQVALRIDACRREGLRFDRQRHRPGPQRGTEAAPVPSLRTGRRRAHRGALRRQRTGAGDLPGTRRGDGRPHRGRQQPGQGTRFIVELPLAASPPRRRRDPGTRIAPALPRRRARPAAGRGRSHRRRSHHRPAARAGPSRGARGARTGGAGGIQRQRTSTSRCSTSTCPASTASRWPATARAGLRAPLLAVTARADADAEPLARRPASTASCASR